MGGKEGQRGRKACPFYQYKPKKIKPARGPRLLSEDVSGSTNKNPSKEKSRRSIEARGTPYMHAHAYKLTCHPSCNEVG